MIEKNLDLGFVDSDDSTFCSLREKLQNPERDLGQFEISEKECLLSSENRENLYYPRIRKSLFIAFVAKFCFLHIIEQNLDRFKKLGTNDIRGKIFSNSLSILMRNRD